MQQRPAFPQLQRPDSSLDSFQGRVPPGLPPRWLPARVSRLPRQFFHSLYRSGQRSCPAPDNQQADQRNDQCENEDAATTNGTSDHQRSKDRLRRRCFAVCRSVGTPVGLRRLNRRRLLAAAAAGLDHDRADGLDIAQRCFAKNEVRLLAVVGRFGRRRLLPFACGPRRLIGGRFLFLRDSRSLIALDRRGFLLFRLLAGLRTVGAAGFGRGRRNRRCATSLSLLSTSCIELGRAFGSDAIIWRHKSIAASKTSGVALSCSTAAAASMAALPVNKNENTLPSE